MARQKANALAIVSAIAGGTHGSEVARRHGITRQRVQQIWKTHTGLPLPRRETQPRQRIDPGVNKLRRAWARIHVDANGCWIYTGGKSGPGYGHLWTGYAHRWTYEAIKGPIPAGLQIDHLCRVRRCASPAHLEAVTHRTNTLRGESPAAIAVAMNACDRGHEFDLINTYWTPDGKRHCRACILIRRERARETQAS